MEAAMRTKIHPDVRKLIDEISDYRARNNLDRTKFGILAANDGHLIPRLQSGRLPRGAAARAARQEAPVVRRDRRATVGGMGYGGLEELLHREGPPHGTAE